MFLNSLIWQERTTLGRQPAIYDYFSCFFKRYDKEHKKAFYEKFCESVLGIISSQFCTQNFIHVQERGGNKNSKVNELWQNLPAPDLYRFVPLPL